MTNPQNPPPAVNVELPQDVINLVIAAREAFDCAFLPDEESRTLDKALEPFASKVRYANEPDDEATASEGSADGS